MVVSPSARLRSPKNRQHCLESTISRSASSQNVKWLPPPQEGKQTEMFNCLADVLFTGGAAGSGKSRYLLIDAAKQGAIQTPGYNAVFFRRSYPQLTNSGGLISESQLLYREIGGRFTSKPPTWRWGAGSELTFRPLQHEDSVYDYQGAQFCWIGFDELCQFCLTPDHEVLTESGWKFIADVSEGEKVASYSPNRNIEYKKSSPVSFDYEGEMLGIKNDCITTLMTPNHKVIVEKQLPNKLKTPGNIFSGWKFRDVSEVYGKNIYIPRTGNYNGCEVKFYELFKVNGRGIGRNGNTIDKVKMDDWLVFLGWYFSEGCSYESINKNAVTGRGSPLTSIRQTKKKNKPEIREMLDRLGFKWNETSAGQFNIFSRQLYENLKGFGKGAKEKRVPRWLFSLSPRQIGLFLDAFVKGDGYVNSSGGIQIGLCNKGLIDDLQELYFLCGLPAYSSHFVTKTGFDVYSLNVISCNRSNTSVFVGKGNWFKQDYKGKVHCLLVEDNHNFLVRHKGHIFWTGNSATQFFYLLSRNRSGCGVKPKIRATMNPDADSWVSSFIQWWWNPETGLPIPERSGIIRYFLRFNEVTYWGDSKQELISAHRDKLQPVVEGSNGLVSYDDMIKSFTFISASIYDNPALLKANPEYLANLNALHEVERQRLLFGNWKIRYEAGLVFSSEWFKIIDYAELPCDPLIKVRFWDLAATSREDAGKKTCSTAGCLMAMIGTNIYILDLLVFQRKAGEVFEAIKGAAIADGTNTKIRYELEGGASSKILETDFAAELQSVSRLFDIKAIKPDKSKLQRALPLATQAQLGHVFLIRGDWNAEFMLACESFDGLFKARINDIVDSATGAYEQITNPTNAVIIGNNTNFVGYLPQQQSQGRYI